jgi:hypothetical protein
MTKMGASAKVAPAHVSYQGARPLVYNLEESVRCLHDRPSASLELCASTDQVCVPRNPRLRP